MDWQTPIALLVVAIAAGVTVRWCWQTMRGSASGCNKGCGHCPSNASRVDGEQLVELTDLSLRLRK